MNLTITKIIRKDKFRSRVETSDGKQLVINNGIDTPYIGMELDINAVGTLSGELRPLKPGDAYPQIIGPVPLE